jgi:hypothetical protein
MELDLGVTFGKGGAVMVGLCCCRDIPIISESYCGREHALSAFKGSRNISNVVENHDKI